MTTRSEFEQMCRKADMEPATRGSFSLGEVYIADGFTKNPATKFQKFGVELGDFPNGCYATIWAMFQGDKFIVADALFFDPMHDLAMANRRAGRVRRAMERAEEFAATMVRVRENPISDKEAAQTAEFFNNIEENNLEFSKMVSKTNA